MNAPERLDILAAQEAALALGKRAVHDNVTDRALRLLERARNSGHARIPSQSLVSSVALRIACRTPTIAMAGPTSRIYAFVQGVMEDDR